MQRLEETVVYSVTHQSWIDSLAGQLQQVFNGIFLGSDAARRVKDFLNGVWLAHPLHPSVTDVPVGSWTTAVVLDGIESATGRNMEPATSTAIGLGVGGAVISAASGIADWVDAEGTQRRVGLVHATLNTVALTLFGASLWRRLGGYRQGSSALSNAGWLAMFVAAYLGGELSFRLGTQVHRDAWARAPRDFVPMMNEADLPVDRPVRADAQGAPVMLVRHGGAIYALNDVCSHAGCSLSGGGVVDGTIVCPCHGSTYMLEGGAALHGPSPYAQPHYDVRIRGGQIEVRSALQ